MLAAVLLLSFVGHSLAATIPARASTQTLISDVVLDGTGCPSGSGVKAVYSADYSSVSLTFSDYVATVGPSSAVTDSRQNCQLNLNLNYPSGYQFSVKSAAYSGYASLEQDITAAQKSTYYFSGQSAQTTTSTNLQGPSATDYDRVDTAADASLSWSPCGSNAMLNIDSEVDIQDGSSSSSTSSYINTNSIEVEIQWRTC